MPLNAIREAVGKQRRWAKLLWERLDARLTGADYRERPLSDHNAVVVGAGPVGLRAALELRLLGAEVVVLERRRAFDRVNRLHLWRWCGEDLKGWAAKVLEPPGPSFGADPDFLHIGISELQMLLLKNCLLLGVQVFFGTEYLCSKPSCRSGVPSWDVVTGQAAGRDDATAPPGPMAPRILPCTSILLGADGPRGSVASAHDFRLQESKVLRKGGALGLVVNYRNRGTSAERRRRPFSLARQFYPKLFKDCEGQTGCQLENIVCYISPQTHYFVMTPTMSSLQSCGVIPPDIQDGEACASVNEQALAELARQIVAYPWKPEEPVMPEEALNAPAGHPAIFDFSKQKRAASGLRVVEAPGPVEEGVEAEPAGMLVALCGDALMEPFWPEGLGVVRGFFAALDVASAARVWAQTGSSEAAVLHFESAFRQLRSLAAQTREAVCRPNETLYGLDPSTRYRYVSGSGRCASLPSLPPNNMRTASPSPEPERGSHTWRVERP